MSKKSTISEAELRDRFLSSIASNEHILSLEEIPVFSRSVDLALLDNKDGLLTAIEFKLHDWKRAIAQIRSVDTCFDYLYICIPQPRTKTASENILSTCASNGIGLIVYDEAVNAFNTLLHGQKTSSIWKTQRNLIIEYLEAKANGTTIENA